jgi:hypothetical protein
MKPHVALSAGPVARSTNNYAVPFQWRAWDDDGAIDHFLYTIDNTDTTWLSTEDHTKTLIFSATTQLDSVNFTGWHTFYLKAVDNQGAESDPVDLTFNALTQAPQTKAIKPVKLAAGNGGINAPLFGGPTVRLEWEGRDPDGAVHREPVAYEIRRIQTASNLAGNWEVARDLLLSPDADTIQVPGTVKYYVFEDLASTGSNSNWLFWVRSIDEAGAIEPWPKSPNHWPGYFFYYFSQPELQGPILALTSTALGHYRGQGSSRDSTEYVYDRPISITWTGDASDYGGDLDGFRWGVDITDLNDPSDPGWATGWNRNLAGFSGLTFTDRTAPIHDLIVQVRDTNGAITTSTLRITLVTFEFDQDVLFVDDDFETGGNGFAPTSPEHQAFMTTVLKQSLAALGRPVRVNLYDVFPDPSAPYNFKPPRLTDFKHYRVVVWDAGRAPVYNSLWTLAAVNKATPLSKADPLAVYLESGGNLIISGFTNARSTIKDIPTNSITIGENEGLIPGINNIAIDYWHIPNTIWFARSDAYLHGQVAADPTEWSSSNGYLGAYPRLTFDAERWYRLAATGSTGSEAFDRRPPLYEPSEDFYELLYTYGSAAGRPGNGQNESFLHGLPDAQLFKRKPSNPSEDWQYQVAFIGFPWYLFRPAGVTAAMTNLLASCLEDRKWNLNIPATALSAQRAPAQRVSAQGVPASEIPDAAHAPTARR